MHMVTSRPGSCCRRLEVPRLDAERGPAIQAHRPRRPTRLRRAARRVLRRRAARGSVPAMFAARGMTAVATADLERLLRAVHRGTLAFPISRAGLIAHAFGDIEGELDLLVGRDQDAARALLVAVIAERRARERV